MRKSKRKNQKKDQLDLQNAKVPNSGRIRWHRIHKSVAPSFPEPARDGEEVFLQIPQGTLFLIQNKRRLSKYSL
jgi:hypothetical protein